MGAVLYALDESADQVRTISTATRSVFPVDAQALIYRHARPNTMSAPMRQEQWKLKFERRAPLRIEPLMGWTEDDDPFSQVELSFPSAEAAIAYARRQGIQYTLLESPAHHRQLRTVAHNETAAAPLVPHPRRRKLEWLDRTLRPNATDVARGATAAA